MNCFSLLVVFAYFFFTFIENHKGMVFMFKKVILSTIFILMLFSKVYSQVNVGGMFGLGITNNYLNVDLAPETSYTFIKNLRVGASPFFLYNKDLSSSYWMMMFGGRIFGEFHFDFNIFVHAEYEFSHLSDAENNQATVNSLPIGLGGTTELSDRMEAYALVLYDVLYDKAWSIQIGRAHV